MAKHLGSFFKRTPDDWHPSFRIQTDNHIEVQRALEVRLHDLNSGPGHPPLWRICVSGGDDTRMEFDTNDKKKFDAIVAELVRMEPLSMDDLYALGFTYQ